MSDVMNDLKALEICLDLLARVRAFRESGGDISDQVEQKLRWAARDLARQIWLKQK